MADTLSTFNTLKDFYSPLGISLVTISLTYFLSRLNSYKNNKAEAKSKKLSYIDFFKLELNKIIDSFDQLLDDLDEGQAVFQYKNINKAVSTCQELKKMIPDVVIFSDEALREKIINNIDTANSLAIDIQAVENIKDQWKTELDNIINATLYEANSLRIELLKYDISLDDNLIIDSLNKKKINPKVFNYVLQMVQRINNKRNTAFNESSTRTTFIKDKRTILSNRILDSKSELLDLKKDLEELRDSTLN